MGTIPNKIIDTLKTQLRGNMLLPDDQEYEDERRIWNAMIDRRPAGIIQCAGVRRAFHLARGGAGPGEKRPGSIGPWRWP